MSRIGKKPVAIPDGVNVTLSNGNVVQVKGPKGSLENKFHPNISIKIEDNNIIVERSSDEKFDRSLHGLTRTLIFNMIEGVTKGFEKTLEINGVGYRAAKQGNKLVLNLGYSHPIEMEEPEGITVEVPAANRIIVKGADKQAVGEFAAKIRSKRKPEPYKGKGIKYSDEVIRRKEGKSGSGK
ncbi:MAG TPA: 50S ribosomal protein L6 [Clostridiaceae bacterium]|jgi:large subunit ribosomal protein L6|nr:50S ribosomal protein L6 [Clostridiaceae bacterium]HOA30838.1 50S ribosomal protein L6 [Clostridia bacterium]